MPDVGSLTGVDIYLDRGFSPQSFDFTAFRPMAGQEHCGGRTWWRKISHLMSARKQRNLTGKGQGQHLSSEGMSSPLPSGIPESMPWKYGLTSAVSRNLSWECFHPRPATSQDLSWEVMASPLPNCLPGSILWKHGFIPAQLSPRICHEKAWPHLCPVVSQDLSPEGMVSLLPRCLPGSLFQQWVTFLIMGEPSHSLWKDPSRHRPFINLQVY